MKRAIVALLTVCMTAAALLAAETKEAAQCTTYKCQPEAPVKTRKKAVKKYPLDDWKKLVITHEQLAKFNGKNGNPAYVSVDGIVYDVSAIPAWKNGEHKMGLKAGNELSEAFAKAPPFHKANKVLNKAIKIGVYKGGPLDPAVVKEKK